MPEGAVKEVIFGSALTLMLIDDDAVAEAESVTITVIV